MEKSEELEDSIVIGKEKIPIKIKEINHNDLLFYPENPRVYNVLISENGEQPSQDEIEKYMCSLDHVKQLKLSIEANGGLIDPLIVRDGDYVVFEGNSRLAAYKLLAEQDPAKWALVKCKVLPRDVKDETVFKLLGNYHITGKKDWDPFEQAHYLYRRKEKTQQPVTVIAEELGIPYQKALSSIRVIEFMKKYGDLNKRHWSYYDEYLKNSALRPYRETNDSIDDSIATQIKDGEISDAKDLRKLGKIAAVKDNQSKKIMRSIIDKRMNIIDGYERMQKSGKLEDGLKELKKFRSFLNDKGSVEQLKCLARENKATNEHTVEFELKKIITKLNAIKKEIDKLND